MRQPKRAALATVDPLYPIEEFYANASIALEANCQKFSMDVPMPDAQPEESDVWKFSNLNLGLVAVELFTALPRTVSRAILDSGASVSITGDSSLFATGSLKKRTTVPKRYSPSRYALGNTHLQELSIAAPHWRRPPAAMSREDYPPIS